MGMANLCNSGTRNIHGYVKRRYNRIAAPATTLVLGSKQTPRWRLLWRKIMKERKRIFDCSSTQVVLSYDPDTYSRNFDQGSLCDSDDMSRSFSARFAVPSRIFEKTELVV